MAKVKLVVAGNVTLNRDGGIRRPGGAFSTDNDDEIQRWVALGYVEKQKRTKK